MSALVGASAPPAFYASLKERAPEVVARYRALTPVSARLAEQARAVMPGGTTRHAVARRPYAPFVVRGEGARLVDADGRRLVDFWFNATALPLGHCDPGVMAAVREQLPFGTSFFAPTARDITLAEEICARLPSAEQVVFTNSGSEAVMMALRIARAATGRPLVGKFEGSYHGSYDDVLWSVSATTGAGQRKRPTAVAASAGLVTAEGRTLVLPYNDLAATERLLRENADHLAVVIVEPVASRMGMVVAKPAFLRGLRESCDRLGIVLVFDEILSFRVGYRGAQGLVGVTPDLTTLGKIIGGGFPVGAVAGRASFMTVASIDADVKVPQYGTFSANPVTMAAGQATLAALTPDTCAVLGRKGKRLRKELRRICRGLPLQISGLGSLFKISATPHKITDSRTARTVDVDWQETASLALLNEGFLLTQQLHGCLATATRDDEMDGFLAAFSRVVGEG